MIQFFSLIPLASIVNPAIPLHPDLKKGSENSWGSLALETAF
jgi:hypothetical protein